MHHLRCHITCMSVWWRKNIPTKVTGIVYHEVQVHDDCGKWLKWACHWLKLWDRIENTGWLVKVGQLNDSCVGAARKKWKLNALGERGGGGGDFYGISIIRIPPSIFFSIALWEEGGWGHSDGILQYYASPRVKSFRGTQLIQRSTLIIYWSYVHCNSSIDEG